MSEVGNGIKGRDTDLGAAFRGGIKDAVVLASLWAGRSPGVFSMPR